jgi:hypothetical protein
MQLCHVSPSYSHRIVLALPLDQTSLPHHGPQTPSSLISHVATSPTCLPASPSPSRGSRRRAAHWLNAAVVRPLVVVTSSCSLSHRRDHKLHPLPPRPTITSSPLPPPPLPPPPCTPFSLPVSLFLDPSHLPLIGEGRQAVQEQQRIRSTIAGD